MDCSSYDKGDTLIRCRAWRAVPHPVTAGQPWMHPYLRTTTALPPTGAAKRSRIDEINDSILFFDFPPLPPAAIIHSMIATVAPGVAPTTRARVARTCPI